MNLSFVGEQITPPNLKPALSPNVQLTLTVVYTTLYGLLFFIIYVQLWMILYYKHRRLSYQTVFLSLCLIWAALRVTLFVFYFRNTVQANNLGVFLYWLFYCFPVCLQFITLCLLVVFFSQVVVREKPVHERSRFMRPVWTAGVAAVGIFTATNIVCAVIIQYHKYDPSNVQFVVSIIRVVINGSLFIATAVSLSVAIIKMSKISSTSVVLEARGTTRVQAMAASILIILLYTSRAFYNIIAVCGKGKIASFGYGWINVSDQADFLGLDQMNYAYVSFGIVLFVWEFLPTFVVVMFFRVQKPRTSSDAESLTSPVDTPRGFFFDNPRRYDSDDDLTRPHTESYRDSNGPVSLDSSSLNTSQQPADLTNTLQPAYYDGT